MKYLLKLNLFNKILLLLLIIAIAHYLYKKFYLIEGNNPDASEKATCVTISDLDSKDDYFNTVIDNFKMNFDKKISDLNAELEDISKKCSTANANLNSVSKSINT
jgi:hypothetical protein